MTRFQRKIYTSLFILLFALTAPTLIFFAKGYRFDTIKKVFVHSGSVIVKSTPKKIDIYIDGKKTPNKKLNFINNYYIVNGLRPGKHTVECKKDGYTSWRKEIRVHSGLSVEFWNVILAPVPNQTLQTYSPQNIARFYLSPRNKNELVLYQKNNQEQIISLFNTKDGNSKTLYRTDQSSYDLIPNKEENIEWSSNHKKIMIPIAKDGLKDYIIAEVKNSEQKNFRLNTILQKIPLEILTKTDSTQSTVQPTTSLSTKNSNPATKQTPSFPRIYQARWIFDSDSKIILLTENHHLLIADTKEPTKSILIDQNVNGFDLAGDHIYYTKITDKVIWDIKSNQPHKKKAIANINLPNTEEDFLKMIAYDEYRIALLTGKKKLYLLNNNEEKKEIFFQEIATDINGIQYSDDGKKMLYWSNNEIWVFMLRDWKVQPNRQENEKIFITRFSSGLKNVQWMQTFENILFTNKNLIKMSEIDNRDHINLVNIFQTNSPANENEFIYDKDTSILYFLDTTNNSTEPILQSITLMENNGFLNLMR